MLEIRLSSGMFCVLDRDSEVLELLIQSISSLYSYSGGSLLEGNLICMQAQKLQYMIARTKFL